MFWDSWRVTWRNWMNGCKPSLMQSLENEIAFVFVTSTILVTYRREEWEFDKIYLALF